MDNPTAEKLFANLKAEQIRVLMAIKPDAKARTTWNRALQAVVDSMPDSYWQARVKGLFLEVTI